MENIHIQKNLIDGTYEAYLVSFSNDNCRFQIGKEILFVNPTYFGPI